MSFLKLRSSKKPRYGYRSNAAKISTQERQRGFQARDLEVKSLRLASKFSQHIMPQLTLLEAQELAANIQESNLQTAVNLIDHLSEHHPETIETFQHDKVLGSSTAAIMQRIHEAAITQQRASSETEL